MEVGALSLHHVLFGMLVKAPLQLREHFRSKVFEFSVDDGLDDRIVKVDIIVTDLLAIVKSRRNLREIRLDLRLLTFVFIMIAIIRRVVVDVGRPRFVNTLVVISRGRFSSRQWVTESCLRFSHHFGFG